MKQLSIFIFLIFHSAFVEAQTEKSTPKGHRFSVDNVEIAPNLLKTNDVKKEIENKIKRTVSYFPEELIHQKIIGCYDNAFIETLYKCYDQHRPLVLSPDAIWMTICQGVSLHINENHKELESIIFHAEKPETLRVRNDSLEYASIHWNQLVASLSEETKKYTKDDFYSFFVGNFSTTTIVERTAFQITLLEGFKKTFKYISDTGCGIPSITITGTPNDWNDIMERLEMLPKLGLSDWHESLKPIIGEFILAAKGKPTTSFWQNIYKNSQEYGAFYLSGWMLKLFPYVIEIDYPDYESENLITDDEGSVRAELKYYKNPFLKGDDYLLSTLIPADIPSGISNVPLIWNNHFSDETKEMELLAGFFGIKQYDDKSLEPLIGWAVCEKEKPFSRHELPYHSSPKTKHQEDYWTPKIIKNPSDFAIYDIKTHKTKQESDAFLKKYIQKELDKSEFKTLHFSGDAIEFIVLSNGKITNVNLIKNKDEKLAAFFTKILNDLPNSWFPALTYVENAMEIIDFQESKEKKIKIKVNSRVKIEL